MKESRWIRALVFFARTNLRRPWSTVVHSTDAPLGGGGVAVATFSEDEVYQVGKFDERWRFKLEYASPEGHRQRALRLAQADPFSDMETVIPIAAPEQPEWGVRRDFPEVPPCMLQPEWWRVATASPWQYRASIHTLEGRAAVSAVRRIARSLSSRGRRHLLFQRQSVCNVCSLQRPCFRLQLTPCL